MGSTGVVPLAAANRGEKGTCDVVATSGNHPIGCGRIRNSSANGSSRVTGEVVLSASNRGVLLVRKIATTPTDGGALCYRPAVETTAHSRQ